MNVLPSTPMIKAVPLPKYIEIKIKMLRKDFCIKPNADELTHLRSLKSEMSVDRYVRDLFNKYLK